jgi:hypothetical protein
MIHFVTALRINVKCQKIENIESQNIKNTENFKFALLEAHGGR